MTRYRISAVTRSPDSSTHFQATIHQLSTADNEIPELHETCTTLIHFTGLSNTPMTLVFIVYLTTGYSYTHRLRGGATLTPSSVPMILSSAGFD